MKRIVLSILVIFMIVRGARAVEVEIDEIRYDVVTSTKDAKVIKKAQKYTGNVVIPASIIVEDIEYSVTAIGESAFYYCTGLTSVTIPSSVTTIGQFAFSGCSGLTSVTIPPSVTNISSYIFTDCSALTTVTIPSSVTNIPYATFERCSSLASVTIPSSVTTIEDHAFYGCSSLTSVTIPSSVTSIGGSAFYKCTSLTSVNIPSSVTSIGSCAFYYCSGLTSMTIPSSVTVIESDAFCACSGLTSVIIPSSVTSIKSEAFASCRSLTSLDIPLSVTNIGNHAFSGCSGLTSVTIPSSVTTFGDFAFSNCFGLTSVAIPSSVTTISRGAFSGCTGLTSVIIPSSVTSIGERAFERCSGLISVVIPSSVTSFGSSVFSDCTGLSSVTIPSSITAIGERTFCRCSGLTSVTIPSSVTSIGGSAFESCTGLTSVTISEGVTSIGGSTFSGCTGLTSITIPSSVTTIGSNAFSNCRGLTSVVIPSSVTRMGDSAFQTCTGLTSVTIQEGATTIGISAFYACTGLTSVTIPSSVTSIGGGAFSWCTHLVDMYCYAANLPSISSNPFHTIVNSTLHVPASAIDEYRTTAPWSGFGTIVALPGVTYWVDGQIYKQTTPIMGDAIIPEPIPVREGYTFSGWSEIPETMPDHDVTVTGTFSINQYTIKFVVDGEEVASKTQDYQTAVTAPEIPEREGYTFTWENLPETVPAHDVIVTGTFTAKTYKLSYFVDNQLMQTIDVNYDSPIVPMEEPAKEGYTFSGWSEIPTTMPAHDVTVTGSFTINSYKLTYLVDGETYKETEVEYGAEVTPEPDLEKDGFTFSGWSDIPETMPAHDVVVTGTFSKGQYKLIYVVDGETYKTYSKDYQDAITAETAPEREGYTFSGWSEIPETMPAHDVTITGTFTINQYTITFIIDGETYSSVVVDYGSTIVPPETPERAGSTFTWGEYPETMPAHDITIEGTYTDGIDFVQGAENVEIYTIDGKKVNRMQRGVNILKVGKKIVKVAYNNYNK